MKKILISAFALFMIASTAYASVNGLYKGRPIVNVVVNGEKVTSTVPGQIVDNATLLPLRAIGEALGASVDWDAQTYTATITTAPEGLSLAELNEIGKSVGHILAYAGDKPISQGSGFVTDDVLVTNYHVVDEDATKIVVTFGMDQYSINVSDALFVNEDEDLAGFRIRGMKGLDLANQDDLKQGSKVYTLGYPENKFKITEGTTFGTDKKEVVHSAITGPGGSGGALINTKGEVVGVSVKGYGGVSTAIHFSLLSAELSAIP